MITRTATPNVTHEYPDQPIHSALIRRLYLEAERLERRAERSNHLPLPFDIGSRLVASTLRWLDRQGECLKPRSTEALSALKQKALKNLRLRWYSTTKRDYGRAAERAESTALLAIETLVSDVWQPTTDLYGDGCTLLGNQGRFPGDDLLGGETGRHVLEALQREFGLPDERALAVLLSCILPKFPRVLEALTEMGYSDFSPSYLRKWAGQEVPHLLECLRPQLEEWGLGAGAQEPPPKAAEEYESGTNALATLEESFSHHDSKGRQNVTLSLSYPKYRSFRIRQAFTSGKTTPTYHRQGKQNGDSTRPPDLSLSRASGATPDIRPCRRDGAPFRRSPL